MPKRSRANARSRKDGVFIAKKSNRAKEKCLKCRNSVKQKSFFDNLTMTFEQKTRTLAAAAGCLAVLGSAVCEAAEEGREAPQEKANKDLPVKVCPSAPRQEAPAMPSLESVIAVWGFPMKMLADGYVEYDGWVGRQEFGTVMAFWKADSRTSAWYGLMNYPEDLADLSLRFKYVRTTATRFEVDCEGRKLRAVERVRTAAPFIKGEVFARRPLSRKWVNIFDGHIDPKASTQIEDREGEIFERSFAMACSRPE